MARLCLPLMADMRERSFIAGLFARFSESFVLRITEGVEGAAVIELRGATAMRYLLSSSTSDRGIA